MTSEWVWLLPEIVLAIHDEQLAEHGGPPGMRDRALLESALARPQQRASYGDPDVAELAAAYAFGIARNHPFVDGNKRTAFVAAELFISLNGFDLVASDEACILVMVDLAAGSLGEDDLAQWLRRHLRAE